MPFTQHEDKYPHFSPSIIILLVIRGLALGTLNDRTRGQFLIRELKMAGSLSAILSLAGFLRAAVFRTPFPETLAVTASLVVIVFTSICLGAVLPLLLQKLGVDPAHSSTTIQVVMDILGCVLWKTVQWIFTDTVSVVLRTCAVLGFVSNGVFFSLSVF